MLTLLNRWEKVTLRQRKELYDHLGNGFPPRKRVKRMWGRERGRERAA